MKIEDYRFVAHRGLYNKIDAPENSIKAFENAIVKGYAIELDVQMTKDGYLVIFHDETLKRMTGIKDRVDELCLKDIKRQKLLGSDYTIPTFNEVLLLVDSKVPLMIEVKTTEKYKEVMSKLMKMLDRYKGEYIIESFDPRIVYWLKKNRPNVIRGQLAAPNIKEVNNKMMKKLLGKMAFNKFTKPNFISYVYTHVDEKFYNKQKKKERIVSVWTVKNKEEYLKIKNCSDIVIFENEDTIK